MKKLTSKQVKIVAHLIDCEVGMMKNLDYIIDSDCDYANTYAYKVGVHSTRISSLTDLLINGYDEYSGFEFMISNYSSVYLEGVKLC